MRPVYHLTIRAQGRTQPIQTRRPADVRLAHTASLTKSRFSPTRFHPHTRYRWSPPRSHNCMCKEGARKRICNLTDDGGKSPRTTNPLRSLGSQRYWPCLQTKYFIASISVVRWAVSPQGIHTGHQQFTVINCNFTLFAIGCCFVLFVAGCYKAEDHRSESACGQKSGSVTCIYMLIVFALSGACAR